MIKRNIRLVLMYDGSGYLGWQKLGITSVKRPIQTILEECLSEYLKEEIKIIGSGRTDAGVHALGQVANFYCRSLESVIDMKKILNGLLPKDIAILLVEEVDKGFHSRYSAKSKTYQYRIEQGETQSVFARKYAYYVPTLLNEKDMIKASTFLVGTHDFKAFSTDRKDGKSTIKTIESIEIHSTIDQTRNSKNIHITITGDGFLYNMVRIIIGTLIEVGEGKRPPEEVSSILKSRDRQKAGITVSSHGLFLLQVQY